MSASNPIAFASTAPFDDGVFEIFIDRLKIDAAVGVADWERLRTQPILISMRLTVAAAPRADDDDRICYDAVVSRIRGLVADRRFALVEDLAERIADLASDRRLDKNERIDGVVVTIEKPIAVADVRHVGVTLTRRRRR